MHPVEGDWFDGRTPRRHRVVATVRDGGLVLRGAQIERLWPRGTFERIAGVGGTPEQLIHRDGEVWVPDRSDPAALAALLEAIAPARASQRWLDRLESHTWVAVVALLVAVAVGWSAIRFGAPLAARVITPQVPLAWEARLGDQAWPLLDGDLFTRSGLDPARRRQVQAIFEAVLAAARQDAGWNAAGDTARLEFRDSRLGANAFALPGGRIVVTDAMVLAARNDAELAGVLAHELGHVRHRHGLQSLLAQSVTAIVLLVTLGDASTVSSLAVAVPAMLIDSAYSRDLEREADDHAISVLRRTDWSPSALADLFERLGTDAGGLGQYVSSHPATAERIRRLRQ